MEFLDRAIETRPRSLGTFVFDTPAPRGVDYCEATHAAAGRGIESFAAAAGVPPPPPPPPPHRAPHRRRRVGEGVARPGAYLVNGGRSSRGGREHQPTNGKTDGRVSEERRGEERRGEGRRGEER